MLTRRRLLALAALAPLAACAGGDPVRPGTTLIVLRHADRSGLDLDSTGRARARALVAALEGYEIDAIYAPDIRRNMDTARPLAEARGLTIRNIPPTGIAAQLTAAHPGGTVVWIGNRDNLRALWAELGADGPPPVEYGDLFIVETTAGAPRITRRRHGP